MPRYEQPTFELENNRAAVLLDRLADKIDRYKSHDEFLRKCIENKVTPLSYKVFLEPSISNHDENFLKGYHDMLEGFSRQVMEYTAKKKLPISKRNNKMIQDQEAPQKKYSPK